MSAPLVYSILKYIDDQRKHGGLSEENAESLEVAGQCLESVYGFSLLTDESTYSLPVSLEAIFEAGLQSLGYSSSKNITEDDKKLADQHKAKGNEYMGVDLFQEAISEYSKAISIDRTNPVYHCNRAAAKIKINDNKGALDDCRSAINIDQNYSKAYARMGSAYIALNNPREAVENYTKALNLDPSNTSYQQNLEIAEKKMREANIGSGAPGGSGIPGLGNFDISSLLNNPALMNMASSMMQNPDMQRTFSQMMGGGAVPGGAMPGGEGGESGTNEAPADFSNMQNLLQMGQNIASQMQQSNPELVEQLRNRMQSGNTNSNNSENDGSQ